MKPTPAQSLSATAILRPGFDISVVSCDPEFAALNESWNALAGQVNETSVFLTYDWFAAAWAWRRLDADLALLLGKRGDELVGILPLIVRRTASTRPRRLELLTVPDTQQCDLIVADGNAHAISEAFAAALASRNDWDVLHLDLLTPTGVCARLLVPALRRQRLCAITQDRGGNSFVKLGGSWEDYYRARSRRLKKALNLAANRLDRSGQIEIEWFRSGTGNEHDLRQHVATVIGISARSWKRSTGNSLDQPGPQAFIRSLSWAAFQRGWLSIWIIRVDDRPLAMEFQLIFGGSVHALRADFDVDAKALSPGSHLFRHLLESLFGRGLARYYLGPGDNPYKKRWTDEEGEPLIRATAYNRTLSGRVAYWREEIVKPLFRRVSAPPTCAAHHHSSARR